MCSKTLAWYRSPQWQCRLECIQCGASDHTFRECVPSNNCLGEEGTFKIVSPALVCCQGMHICLTWGSWCMSVWDDPTLGSQNHYVHQRTRSARYNCGASTPTLATRDVAYQLQDTCTLVPRSSWYAAVCVNSYTAVSGASRGFSGCPEPPQAMIFFNSGGGVTPLLAPTFTSHLQFATFGNPPWDQLWIRHWPWWLARRHARGGYRAWRTHWTPPSHISKHIILNFHKIL